MHSLYENYELFLRDNKTDLASPQQGMKILMDNGFFNEYVQALVDGLDDTQRRVVTSIANRQREYLLAEAANVLSSAFGQGWTVLSFPVLVDIYAEPLIAELCNVYPVSSPVVSIPRIKIKASVKGYSSGTDTYKIPTALNLVRPGFITVNASYGSAVNLFTLANVDSTVAKLNRRYTLITKVVVTETYGQNSTFTINMPVTIRPDNRNQFVATFTGKDHDDKIINCTLHGNVNYDSGTLMYNVLISGGSTGSTYTCSHVEVKVRFVPFATMKGRTIVNIENELTDVTIDPNEDFLIQLTQEELQDYRAIFQIDLVRTLSEAIKRQILLNKDYDLAYFLAAAETEMDANGAKIAMNIGDFVAGSNAKFEPNHSIQVLKNLVTRISTLSGIIKRNFNMYPTYIVAGYKTAAALRALQDLAVSLGGPTGELGFVGAASQFMKMKVLDSLAIPSNKIYLSTKAPGDALEYSTIIDLVFEPLYIVQEVTDGNTRNFVRSRTMIEIARTEGLGVIEVSGLDTVLL